MERFSATLKGDFHYDSRIGRIDYDSSGDLREQVIHTNVVRAGQFVPR